MAPQRMLRGAVARRPSLLAWFLGSTALVFLVLGVLLVERLHSEVSAQALSDARASAQLLADATFAPLLTRDDVRHGMSSGRRAELDRVVHATQRDGLVARVKVWSPTGRIVYSDDPAEVNRRFPVSKGLSSALWGRGHADIADGDEAENAAERRLGTLVEAYVPLHLGSRSSRMGAFELYLPYGPVAAAANASRHGTVALVGGGLLALYLLLVPLVAAASGRLRRQAREAARRAGTEPLTGLANGSALHARLDRRAASGIPSAVVAFDVDDFRSVNDSLGHEAGDEVLRELGRRMRDERAAELAARLGADQFALVCDPADVRAVRDRVIEAVRAPVAVGDVRLRLRAAVGVAVGDDLPGAEILRRADIAMHDAKRSGDPWRAYTEQTHEERLSPLDVAHELREGLDGDEVVVAYQPQLGRDGELVAFEALVRWRHPRRGMLSPAAFVPVVERTDLAPRLTERVLDLALGQCARWHREHLPLRVSVNVTAVDLLDVDFAARVMAAADRHDLALSDLTVEITETSVLADPVRVAAALADLRERGVRVALDDFGTGYSSLAHLAALPVDEVKIDRSFVTGVLTDDRRRSIVQATVDLARGNALEVVAEGVEDQATADALIAMGCDLLQGYHLGRPAFPEAIELDAFGIPAAA